MQLSIYETDLLEKQELALKSVLESHVYQYGPTGSVDREFVDIVREKKRKRGKE